MTPSREAKKSIKGTQGSQKAPKMESKATRKVKKSRFLEKAKTVQNQRIYYGLATCSLCAEVAFLEQIVKKTRPESSLRPLHTKLEKVAQVVPKWSPRGSQNPAFDDSCRISFFIWGPFGVLWRPWGARVPKIRPRDSKWSPEASKK